MPQIAFFLHVPSIGTSLVFIYVDIPRTFSLLLNRTENGDISCTKELQLKEEQHPIQEKSHWLSCKLQPQKDLSTERACSRDAECKVTTIKRKASLTQQPLFQWLWSRNIRAAERAHLLLRGPELALGKYTTQVTFQDFKYMALDGPALAAFQLCVSTPAILKRFQLAALRVLANLQEQGNHYLQALSIVENLSNVYLLLHFTLFMCKWPCGEKINTWLCYILDNALFGGKGCVGFF